MNAPEDLFTGHPLRSVPYAAAALCIALFVALPNAAPAFLLPRKPSVDERGLDRGVALEVEERLRRWRESPEQPMWGQERPMLDAWTDFRRNAIRWAPALCRIARTSTHPQRLDAITALRFFGSEHAWEHWSHERDGTPCILGIEPCRDDCERALRGLVRERGRIREFALSALSAYRTFSAAACLVAEADEENSPVIKSYLNWQGSESLDIEGGCIYDRRGSPGMILIWPGEEREDLERIRKWWHGVENGKGEVFPSRETTLKRWDNIIRLFRR